MNSEHLVKIIALALPLWLVSACDSTEKTADSHMSTVAAAAQVVLDARGQDIYETNCKVCHGMAGTGAPLSGKTSDWQDITSKGMDAVLTNVFDGYQAMPAMGGCFDCSEEDFRQLIGYMTNGTLK